MNTLDDLRSTLHDHAHDLDGLDPLSRSAGIHARVTEQRRRRNAVRGGVALAAVAAVIGGVALTDLGQGGELDPASGLGAPESFTALGWTYALSDAVESDGPTQTISLPASERPYLISWMTDGEGQDVTVTSVVATDSNSDEDNSIWSSSAADWADHVVIAAGPAQEVTVSATGAVDTIAVATYEIDPDEAPAGKGSGKADGFHFREKVADRVLVDAAVAERRSEVRFDYVAPDKRVTITYTCSGVPEGAWVRVSMDGSDDESTYGEGCDDNGMDPGASSNFSFNVDDRGWSKEGTVRMWLSRSEKDATPLPASELSGARLGVALYSSEAAQLWNMELAKTLELRGHTWELVDTVEVESGVPIRLESLPGDHRGPWLLNSAHDATSTALVSHTVQVDGKDIPGLMLSSQGTGAGLMGDILIPETAQSVGVEAVAGAGAIARQALVFYRLID